MVKALAFSTMIAWICSYRGFHVRGGAEGVGFATMGSVVEVSVLILVGDYIMTALMFE
jgi:phospholipid/cholesterol/gamma-HCH transport system permease protein